MTTTISSFKGGGLGPLYRAALRGQLPFAIVAGILYLLMMPLVYLVNWSARSDPGYGVSALVQIAGYGPGSIFCNGVYLGAGQAGLVMSAIVILAFVLALTQNAYLHSKRRTDFYHSLPVRRPQLLRANFLASMTTIYLPFLAVYLLTMALELVFFWRHIRPLQFVLYTGIDLLCCVLAGAVMYLFTTLVAVNVGTVFDSFALTGVLGVLPAAVSLIACTAWEAMLYGSSIDLHNLQLFSPFTFAFQRFLNITASQSAAGDYSGYLLTLGQMAVWAVIGAGLYLAASACYRRRRSEVAEQPQPGGVLQTIVKCFGAFCGGALFLAIFYDRGLVGWVLAIFAGALLIGVIGEVVLSRGVRSLRKNCKWLLLSGALCTVLMVGIRLDPTGYAARVPAPQTVESVSISYRGRFEQLSPNWSRYGYVNDYSLPTTLTDQDSIALLTQAHRAMVENRPPLGYEQYAYDEVDATHPRERLQVTYRLKNGGTFTRYYRRVAVEAMQMISGLESSADFVSTSHHVFDMGAQGGLELQEIYLHDTVGRQVASPELSTEETERLLEAVRQDLLAETLDDVRQPAAPALGYLRISFLYPYADTQGYLSASYYGNSCYVIVGQNDVNTIAELTALGLMDTLLQPVRADSITLLPVHASEAPVHSVYALVPNELNIFGSEQDYNHEGRLVTSDDADQIAAVQAAARAQLRSGRIKEDTGEYSDLVVVRYYQGNQRLGAQLVRITDLPEPLRQQMYAWYDTDDLYAVVEDTLYGVGIAYEDVSGVTTQADESDISVY